ncbi:disulfide bond formation protein B [Deinococcus hopiensis]|uniref:Disulfide bond formation protein DsbB n=1 Tax=Deinococcus hopiensis KR-140 TaxID=695939 RepID=A0A1W1VHY0_9DEIO|nr:disulfide bond formation protein B [Deinococcus hopiensis]SMB92962.1 disulfide bond formation protein DsbB [Deinococcus hopiensis KR-140]
MTRDNRLYLAWVVALAATIGSLYFSEVRLFKPCILCWYQRTMMYPLAVVLGVAALRSDLNVRRYALPLAAIGWLVALYQNLETWGVVPTLRACSTDPASSCGIPWPIWGSGVDGLARLNTVITIPVLSMTAFTLILALLSWRRERSL